MRLPWANTQNPIVAECWHRLRNLKLLPSIPSPACQSKREFWGRYVSVMSLNIRCACTSMNREDLHLPIPQAKEPLNKVGLKRVFAGSSVGASIILKYCPIVRGSTICWRNMWFMFVPLVQVWLATMWLKMHIACILGEDPSTQKCCRSIPAKAKATTVVTANKSQRHSGS